MILGDELAVQVLWIGDAELDTERTYTIVTHQVQIPQKVADLPESGVGISLDIKVLINYEGRIYVTPLGVKSNLVVESVAQHTPSKSVGEDQGSPKSLFIQVILANQRMAHQPMAKMSLVFVPLDLSGSLLKQLAITLPSTKIPGMKPHLLAGKRRRLFIVRPKNLPLGSVDFVLSQ